VEQINRLIAQMTLAEKLGQLTMTAADYAVTGPLITPVSEDAIRSGAIGNLLNLYGAGPTHRIQKIAVEESRLRIPLLLGFDALHGQRTVFPIPLAEAGLFDPVAWEATARLAAEECAGDGLNMTFAPMLDVSRDPRWGRIAESPGEDPFVGSAFAHAKIRGFQNSSLSDPGSIAACAKHWIVRRSRMIRGSPATVCGCAIAPPWSKPWRRLSQSCAARMRSHGSQQLGCPPAPSTPSPRRSVIATPASAQW